MLDSKETWLLSLLKKVVYSDESLRSKTTSTRYLDRQGRLMQDLSLVKIKFKYLGLQNAM